MDDSFGSELRYKTDRHSIPMVNGLECLAFEILGA